MVAFFYLLVPNTTKRSLKFSTDKGEFITKSGDSYYFIENERHGADVLEDTEVIDIFMPLREEYIPDESITDSGKGKEVPSSGGVAHLLAFVELFQGEKKRKEYEEM